MCVCVTAQPPAHASCLTSVCVRARAPSRLLVPFLSCVCVCVECGQPPADAYCLTSVCVCVCSQPHADACSLMPAQHGLDTSTQCQQVCLQRCCVKRCVCIDAVKLCKLPNPLLQALTKPLIEMRVLAVDCFFLPLLSLTHFLARVSLQHSM